MVSETQIRVRYAETDQMGFVYYGNYAAYYEVGRTEALRLLGSTYHTMEEKGVMMPVVELKVQFIKAAKYDDLLTIRTIVPNIPDKNMVFLYEIYNEEGVLLNKGETTLVFISSKSRKRVRCPEWMQELISEASESDNNDKI
ncbi:MAG: acyl-CoA thioesterase [Bacteroidales bacterium]|nr:acyl-CoA thioesterase [Bacteroidales bacterium]